MSNTEINWDGQKITLRPSSIDSFYSCPWQWANVFLGGKTTIPGARAAIGTAIHQGVEDMWLETMLTWNKEKVNLNMMRDSAIESLQGMDKDGLQYDKDENYQTAERTVIEGVNVFVDDIVPYVDIPTAVEQRIVMPLDNKVISDLAGTLDYLTPTALADVKTSKRKPVAAGHVIQQTTYKMLADTLPGHNIEEMSIQGVALTKNPMGHILPLEPDVKRTKYLINNILNVLNAFASGTDPKLLFPGNNKYYLCSPKYCRLYEEECPFING